MSLNYKIIPSRFTNITLCFVILILCLLNIAFLTGSIFGINLNGGISSNNASALTYSTEQDISFTFAPSLSITLSDTDLIIDTLAPGTTAESNAITVSVASNTPYGYALYADVGSNDTSSKYYDTSDLIRIDNINATFTSIPTNASLATLTTDNTWGYSTSKDNGTTWSTYNGLPTATSTSGSTSTDNPAVLIDTNLPADNKSIAIKVAARSSTTQASGVYSNIINFYAVGYPAPPTIDDTEYMQDFVLSPESIKSSMAEHVVYTKKDKRDEQDYTIAKLKDGKIWMTKNLNLAGGTEITSGLSDVPRGYTPPYTSGFQYNNRLPNSSQLGFKNDDKAFVYNSTKISGTDCSSPGCYSYYSWVAATAGSGLSITEADIDAPFSICPRGWKLPTSRRIVDNSSDFYQLAVAYGMSPNFTEQSTPNFYVQAGPNTIPNFLRTSNIYNGRLDNDGFGYYWSSTSGNNTGVLAGARVFYFGSSYVRSNNSSVRRIGAAVRCIAE